MIHLNLSGCFRKASVPTQTSTIKPKSLTSTATATGQIGIVKESLFAKLRTKLSNLLKKIKKDVKYETEFTEHSTGVKIRKSGTKYVNGEKVAEFEYDQSPSNKLIRETYFNPKKGIKKDIKYSIHKTGYRVKESEVITKDGVEISRCNYNSNGKVEYSMHYNPETRIKTETEYATHETGYQLKSSEVITKDGVEIKRIEYNSRGKVDYAMYYDPVTRVKTETKYVTHETGYQIKSSEKSTQDGVQIAFRTYNDRGKLDYSMHYNPETKIETITVYETGSTTGLTHKYSVTKAKDDVVIYKRTYFKSGKLESLMDFDPETGIRKEIQYVSHIDTGYPIKWYERITKKGVVTDFKGYDRYTGNLIKTFHKDI